MRLLVRVPSLKSESLELAQRSKGEISGFGPRARESRKLGERETPKCTAQKEPKKFAHICRSCFVGQKARKPLKATTVIKVQG